MLTKNLQFSSKVGILSFQLEKKQDENLYLVANPS